MVRELAVAISGQDHTDDDSEEDSEDEDEDDEISLLDSISSGCVSHCGGHPSCCWIVQCRLCVDRTFWADMHLSVWQAG